MEPRPPRLPERLLAAVLGSSEAARSVRGDLNEDFARVVARRGHRHARLWYWRESLSLAATILMDRALGRPGTGANTKRREGPVGDSMAANGLVQDIRYAFRAVRADRPFLLFATVIIGLGVGASTAVFSVMSPLMLQSLPFEDAGRLVWIENDAGGGGLSAITSRTSNLRDFRERARSFEGLAGYNAFFSSGSYNLVGVGEPERLVGVGVTDDFLDVLGVTPALGRDFSPEEGVWGGPRAVMLTHGFWVRRFGGDPGVVGTTVTLNDAPHQVVGVLPRTFDFSSVFTPTSPVDLLLTWAIGDETDEWGNTTTIVGRLRPGVTAESAEAELESIIATLEREDPERWGLGAVVSGLQERMARSIRPAMLLLAAAAGLVMLIVCVNLSNMLLARSPRRRREMAVRRTLGATRARLIRQLLIESVLISSGGAVVGVGIAIAATRFAAGAGALDIPMLGSVAIDGRALVFTLAIAVLAGLAVGIVPALQVAEGGEAEALSGSSRGTSASRASRRLRELLVISEVAMACVLLVFGGLVLRSFQHVMEVELGFEPANAIAWELSTSRDFDELAEVVAFYDEIVAGVEAVPGVEAAGLVDALPLGRNRTWGTRVVGKTYEDGEGDGFFPHIVDRRYLATMGIPLLEGRHFTASDDREADWVVIVNETAARTMFPDGEALGRSITMWFGEAEVVGVVGDVKHRALEITSDREIYFPMSQIWDFGTLGLVVRTRSPVAVVTGPVAAAIRAVDSRMPTDDYRTIDSMIEHSVSPRRFTLQLLGAFALSAVLLAGLGIYGVLSYSVTERIPEIRIRMALGEPAADVRRNMVAKTMVLAAVGVLVGTLMSLVGTRLISSLLYGVDPTDPTTFVAMVAILMAVALVSGLVPAIRASRTDSAQALRSA
jgi:predicted permease